MLHKIAVSKSKRETCMEQVNSWLKTGGWNPETVVQDETKCEKDISHLRSYYPTKAKEMVSVLCDLCDQMEFENSSMLVPCPDKETMYHFVDQMYETFKKKGRGRESTFLFDDPTMTTEQMMEKMEKEMLLVMLCDEMHRRRMRYCRRNQLFSPC